MEFDIVFHQVGKVIYNDPACLREILWRFLKVNIFDFPIEIINFGAVAW